METNNDQPCLLSCLTPAFKSSMSDEICSDVVMPPISIRKLRCLTFVDSDGVSTAVKKIEPITAPFSELNPKDRNDASSDVPIPKRAKSDLKSNAERKNVFPGSIDVGKFHKQSAAVKDSQVKNMESEMKEKFTRDAAEPKMDEKLSLFEIQRRKNLQENRKFLSELDLDSSASVLAPTTVEPKPVMHINTMFNGILYRSDEYKYKLTKAEQDFIWLKHLQKFLKHFRLNTILLEWRMPIKLSNILPQV